jgi:hypothetical protein
LVVKLVVRFPRAWMHRVIRAMGCQEERKKKG